MKYENTAIIHMIIDTKLSLFLWVDLMGTFHPNFFRSRQPFKIVYSKSVGFSALNCRTLPVTKLLKSVVVGRLFTPNDFLPSTTTDDHPFINRWPSVGIDGSCHLV